MEGSQSAIENSRMHRVKMQTPLRIKFVLVWVMKPLFIDLIWSHFPPRSVPDPLHQAMRGQVKPGHSCCAQALRGFSANHIRVRAASVLYDAASYFQSSWTECHTLCFVFPACTSRNTMRMNIYQFPAWLKPQSALRLPVYGQRLHNAGGFLSSWQPLQMRKKYGEWHSNCSLELARELFVKLEL